jgi:uncharacterized protein YfdQ (DUF2303 family)
MPDEHSTEAGATLAWAESHLLDDTVQLHDDITLVRRRTGEGSETWQLYDMNQIDGAGPHRPQGTIAVHDASSFAAAVTHRRSPETEAVVYVDETAMALVAVLNDDDGPGNLPGWRDYRVALALRRTPEWDAWKDGQGLGTQQDFAERIEDGLPEITDPAGAVMLEVAQSFSASVDVKFRSGSRLSSGETQFTYEEEITATAGGTKVGAISVPDVFRLSVQPFIGSDDYAVAARLRYRLRAGDLQIGYYLVRPDTVERDAFTDITGAVEEAMPTTLFLRAAAPPHAPGRGL